MSDVDDQYLRIVFDHLAYEARAEARACDERTAEMVLAEEAARRTLFHVLQHPPGMQVIETEVLTDGHWWRVLGPIRPTSTLTCRPVRWWSLADRRKWCRETGLALAMVAKREERRGA